MNSIILHTATRLLVSLLLLASLFLLWRGHNAPGGGFSGGLMAAAAVVLMAISTGPSQTRQALRLDPRVFIAAGLATALAAGLAGVVLGDPLLTGKWVEIDLAGHLDLGTPLLFDVGVYLVVVGVVLNIVLALMEEDEV